ncbi:MAG: methyltransferase domain-containing protein, partial [Desulfovibrionaceae bacterium]|nr:methyltransferase domain-containing protein [Desulfovibrionaceae bacterium]
MPDKDFNAADHFGEDLSSIYDERIREIIPGYEAMHEVAQHLLQEHTEDKANILVAGSGTGHEITVYALSKPQWNIVGFDPSADMLAAAREKIQPFDIENRITLIHGSIEYVNQDALFDGAAS